MSSRNALAGLCVLCALVFGAFASQATAASNGLTAFTCKKNPTGGVLVGEKFKAEHCKEADTSPTGEWRHVEIPANTTTKITGSNKTTGAGTSTPILHSVQAGIKEELSATTVTGEGWMTNAVDPVTGEHYAHGEGFLKYTGVTVVAPALGCKVFDDTEPPAMGPEGQVTTRTLKATTKGQGDRLKFEPASGNTFATFWVTNCSKEAFNGTYEVKGSLTAPVDGATTVATGADVTAQGTLTVRGQKAGLEGSLTLIGKHEGLGETEYTPLSATTVSTP